MVLAEVFELMFHRRNYRKSASHGDSDVGELNFVTAVGDKIKESMAFNNSRL